MVMVMMKVRAGWFLWPGCQLAWLPVVGCCPVLQISFSVWTLFLELSCHEQHQVEQVMSFR